MSDNIMEIQSENSGVPPLKVFLWATPRSVSTTFLKCMTSVPDTSAWYEPYVQMAKFSQDDDPKFFGPVKGLVEKLGGRGAIDKIESGFDASDKTIDWLKEQLEGDFPGKKMVFVKELGPSIARPSPPLFDKIPKGFRHTFLMRNPRRMFNVQNVLKQRANPKFKQNPSMAADVIRPYQHLNELWKHVKAESLEDHPIVIDSDELSQHPKEILEAYCKELGIPFSEELLTWEAGDEVMTKHWMVPKQTILTYRVNGTHTSTFASTGFKPLVKPDDVNNNIPDASRMPEDKVPPEVLAQAKEFVESILRREVPYYEEMYDQRLRVDIKKTTNVM